MQIIRAEVLGLCFGVRDALRALEDIAEPAQVTIHGELVHNDTVLTQLGARGFRMVSEADRWSLPETDTVLITAHGVSNVERARLQAAGKTLVDTTCPLVTRAHQAAQKLQQRGYHVLVIGRRGHVEVQGIVEDLQSYDVLQCVEETRRFPQTRLGVMCQTTTPAGHVEAMRRAIAVHNPDAEICFIDTVCHPTKDHQQALERLLEQVSVVVVVGGRQSNNTRELAARCRAAGATAYHVENAADLRGEWFAGVEVVGLTAGTSTLDSTIDEVQAALHRIGRANLLQAS